MMNPVVHFELPFDDQKRMVDFYTKAFGWQAQILGPEMGDYTVVQTAETDENRMLKEPGRINGGFYKKTKDSDAPTLVISVDDIHEAMKAVEASGGKVLWGASKAGEPDDIPGIGLYSAFLDTEGNRIGALQPSPRMKPNN